MEYIRSIIKDFSPGRLHADVNGADVDGADVDVAKDVAVDGAKDVALDVAVDSADVDGKKDVAVDGAEAGPVIVPTCGHVRKRKRDQVSC